MATFGPVSAGFTSGLSVVDVEAGEAHRIVSGLASISGEGGFSAVGLDAISFHGTLFGIMAESSSAVPEGAFSDEVTAALKAQLGRLLQINPSGQRVELALPRGPIGIMSRFGGSFAR